MKLPSIFVYTHDSIGLGEDGPTHQPIEQLAALRAMPRLNVVRPADANETALALALRARSTDDARRRSRSRARTCRSSTPAAIPDDAIERGAYVLRDADGRRARADPDRHGLRGVTLPRAPRTLLEADGIATRVVSMPCMDTFAAQDAGLPRAGAAAGVPRAGRGRGGEPARLGPLGRRARRRSSGWRRFGASGPAERAVRALRLHRRARRRDGSRRGEAS